MRKISRRDASRFHEPQKITIAYFVRSEEHTSELQSQSNLVCRLLLEKKKTPSITRVGHMRPVSWMRILSSCSMEVLLRPLSPALPRTPTRLRAAAARPAPRPVPRLAESFRDRHSNSNVVYGTIRTVHGQ